MHVVDVDAGEAAVQKIGAIERAAGVEIARDRDLNRRRNVLEQQFDAGSGVVPITSTSIDIGACGGLAGGCADAPTRTVTRHAAAITVSRWRDDGTSPMMA